MAKGKGGSTSGHSTRKTVKAVGNKSGGGCAAYGGMKKG